MYFFTTLNFMKKIQTKLCFITTVSGRTLRGLTTRLVRKPDVPYKGKTSTEVHKVDGPYKGKPFT